MNQHSDYKSQSMKTKFLTSFIFLTFSLSTSAQWLQLGLDIEGDSLDNYFGFSVGMNDSGDRLVVGAPKFNGNGTDAGLVGVFEWNGVTWNQMGSGLNGENPFDQSGTSVSMDSAGSRIAIGARLNDGNGNNSGHVRIYNWNGTAWLQLGADIDGGAIGDESGGAVCLSGVGNRVAIGAEGNDASGPNSGHVRVFEWNGIAWTQVGADLDGEATSDNSGYSVSFNHSGNRLAIGAPLNDGNGNNSGHVRIYEWNGTAWTQLGIDLDGEAVGDQSGHSVSLNAVGDRIVIGAIENNGSGFGSGHVRIYEWNGIAWIQLGADLDGEASGDQFGFSVSMNNNGNRIAVGAPFNGGNGFRSGHVRVYEWNGTNWIQLDNNIDGEASGDWSGYSICSNGSGNHAAIGASLNDGNAIDAGHVRVFRNNLSTGIEDLESDRSFSIYPNPASQHLILESQNSFGEIAQITSITGALLFEFKVTKAKEKIDMSGFRNGIYFLKVGDRIQKVIVAN
jgi:hypothetical protein